ncbi:MAG: hypothetical protein LBU36_05995 [Clostridiales bacterium]|jgi:hypothetical protein|nr:hypothetical protein [Clostridiales bacterium]
MTAGKKIKNLNKTAVSRYIRKNRAAVSSVRSACAEKFSGVMARLKADAVNANLRGGGDVLEKYCESYLFMYKEILGVSTAASRQANLSVLNAAYIAEARGFFAFFRERLELYRKREASARITENMELSPLADRAYKPDFRRLQQNFIGMAAKSAEFAVQFGAELRSVEERRFFDEYVSPAPSGSPENLSYSQLKSLMLIIIRMDAPDEKSRAKFLPYAPGAALGGALPGAAEAPLSDSPARPEMPGMPDFPKPRPEKPLSELKEGALRRLNLFRQSQAPSKAAAGKPWIKAGAAVLAGAAVIYLAAQAAPRLLKPLSRPPDKSAAAVLAEPGATEKLAGDGKIADPQSPGAPQGPAGGANQGAGSPQNSVSPQEADNPQSPGAPQGPAVSANQGAESPQKSANGVEAQSPGAPQGPAGGANQGAESPQNSANGVEAQSPGAPQGPAGEANQGAESPQNSVSPQEADNPQNSANGVDLQSPESPKNPDSPQNAFPQETLKNPITRLLNAISPKSGSLDRLGRPKPNPKTG